VDRRGRGLDLGPRRHLAGGERLSRIAVLGASGSIGAPLVAALRRRGHEVRGLARSSPEHPVDLTTGAGLEPALAGCEVIVNAANAGPRPGPAREVLVDGGRRLLAAAQAAAVRHHVCISIVGCDRVPLGYYRVKVEQEALVEAGPVPFSIVRATQFHPLIAGLFDSAARLRILPGGGARLQPVDPAEVAEALADVAEGEPLAGRRTVAGPAEHDLGELARSWLAARGRRALVVPAPVTPRLGRALRDGALIDPDPDVRGTVGFDAWLTRSAGDSGAT
jgi:uncharacterized protein YbjT (DUF2867 family)